MVQVSDLSTMNLYWSCSEESLELWFLANGNLQLSAHAPFKDENREYSCSIQDPHYIISESVQIIRQKFIFVPLHACQRVPVSNMSYFVAVVALVDGIRRYIAIMQENDKFVR